MAEGRDRSASPLGRALRFSFANYQDHLEVGNLRFTRHMPAEVEVLGRAEAEGWPDEMIASILDMPVGKVPDLRKRFAQAKAVVDAPSPAEAFRRGIRHLAARHPVAQDWSKRV